MTDVTTVFPPDFLGRVVKILDDEKAEKHPNYVACCDHAEEMSWHVYGTKPEKLLKRVRPREDPAITTYRLESYQPITESICKKGLSITHKIFDPNLWSIRFKDSKQAKELEKYTIEDYPVFNSIPNYLSNFILKKMMADPNAVILVQPYKFDIKGSERVMPFASCYHSKDIWLVDYESLLLFDKYEESKTDSGKTIRRWFFTFADKQSIFQLYFEKRDDAKGYDVVTLTEYKHGFNELPAWALGGEYSDSKYGLFESFFYAAVPFWNKAINDDSDVDGAYRMHMWPQKWEVADECEYVEKHEGGGYACNGGYIFNGDRKYKCPGCGGSGYKTAKSPYETHIVNREKFLGTEGTANVQVPFGYVTVPVEATKMLEERAERNLNKGLEALNMDLDIGLNESGKAKEMDRTELNDFLKRVANQMFDVHMVNIYYYFTKYMFSVTDPESVVEIQPEISKPTQFDVYSSVELTEQFTAAKTAKLNPQYLSVLQMQIQNKQFSTNPILLENLNLMISLDPLSEVTPDEVSLQLANGTITKETAVIHDNIKVFISRAMEEHKDFATLEQKAQREILEKYADEVVEENKVEIDQSAIEEPMKEPIDKQKVE